MYMYIITQIARGEHDQYSSVPMPSLWLALITHIITLRLSLWVLILSFSLFFFHLFSFLVFTLSCSFSLYFLNLSSLCLSSLFIPNLFFCSYEILFFPVSFFLSVFYHLSQFSYLSQFRHFSICFILSVFICYFLLYPCSLCTWMRSWTKYL
jgi:hypothetical protein